MNLPTTDSSVSCWLDRIHKLGLNVAELPTTVNNFKHISAFSPLLASSKKLANIHFKMAMVVAFDDAANEALLGGLRMSLV